MSTYLQVAKAALKEGCPNSRKSRTSCRTIGQGLGDFFDNDGVRLKLPTIVNTCRAYADTLADFVGAARQPYRSPISSETKAAMAKAFSSVVAKIGVDTCRRLISESRGHLAEALPNLPYSTIGAHAQAVAAGEIAADAGLVAWDRSFPLIAAYDYLEVVAHARWASCPVGAIAHD